MSSASSGDQRIAFFGGSFDPPHIGHVAIAVAAQQALALDRVLFAPVALQPLKPTGSSASFEDRLAMLRLAIAGHPGFELSLLDAPNPAYPSPNYTFDTLIELRRSLSSQSELLQTELFLLLGADSFRTLRNWHRASELLFLANLVVASRPHEDLGNLQASLPSGISVASQANRPNQYRLTDPAGKESQLILLPDLHYDVSATQLRNQIQGQSAQPPLLDRAVLEYIREHHLYARSGALATGH